jgi:hypothetical protein
VRPRDALHDKRFPAHQLGEALARRSVSPHVFEAEGEARAALCPARIETEKYE